MPAICCQLRCRRRRICRRAINRKRDPHEQPVLYRLSKQHIIQHGIGVVLQLALHNTVLGVSGDGDCIGGVRAQRLDLGNQVLVEEELSNVRDGAAGVRAVWQDLAVEMRLDMHVCCAAGVMAGEDGGELRNTVFVSGLQAAEVSGVDVGGVGGVAVAFRDDAAVDAGGVAVPDVGCEVDDWEAGRDVDELQVNDYFDARLVVSDVRADVFSLDV